MGWGHRGPTTKETLGGRRPTTTWVPLIARALEGLEDQTRARGLTGETTSKVDVGRRILTEARTFTAEERRAGDLDPATRGEEEGATGGEEGTEVEEEGTEGTGALRTGSPETEETSEDGETTGLEEEAPAGPEVEVTLTSTVARKRASTAQTR